MTNSSMRMKRSQNLEKGIKGHNNCIAIRVRDNTKYISILVCQVENKLVLKLSRHSSYKKTSPKRSRGSLSAWYTRFVLNMHVDSNSSTTKIWKISRGEGGVHLFKSGTLERRAYKFVQIQPLENWYFNPMGIHPDHL